MARLCERPGCSAPADVAYGFDAEALSVWLDGFHAAQGARSGVLCRRHADAMVVPLGWMLDDRREPVPRLFRAPAEVVEVAPAPPPSRRRSRQRPGDDTLQLRLDAIADDLARIEADDPDLDAEATPAPTPEPTDEPIPEAEVEVEAQPEPVAPWLPVFDQSDDLSGLLKARGRLLSRAFNGAAPDGD
jgi:hypothetical protein